MSKSFTYIIVLTTLVIGLSLLGIINGTSYHLFKDIGIIKNTTQLSETNYTLIETQEKAGFSMSTFYDSIFGSGIGILSIISATAAIFVGFALTKDPTLVLRVAFAAGLGAWITSDLVFLFGDIPAMMGAEFVWATVIIRAFIAILWMGFAYSIVLFATGGGYD